MDSICEVFNATLEKPDLNTFVKGTQALKLEFNL